MALGAHLPVAGCVVAGGSDLPVSR